MQYEVGLAELDDRSKIVVKIKEKYRGQEPASHSRKMEYQNLQMLQELNEQVIPEPLHYQDGILLMSFIDGATFAKSDKDEIEPSQFEELGRVVRRINDISVEKAQHLLVVKDFTAFFEDRKEHLYKNRLVLDYFSQKFYDQAIDELRGKITPKKGDLGVIWKDGNADNILFKDNKLVGMIDFEDMAFAPRIVQFYSLKSIGDDKMDDFAKGYGKDMFQRNYDEAQLKILKVFSVFNALGLAYKENAAEWFDSSLEKLDKLLTDLDLPITLPKK